jgi:TIR domain
MAQWKAFWSYVHQDDDDDHGRILDLCSHISNRVRFRTGVEFEIFHDREGLHWGDDWQEKLDEALQETAFLIPVVTPSYFLSVQCRRELIQFSSTAESLGLAELILPIYYMDSGQLDADIPDDEIVRLIKKYQWEDFRPAALADYTSSIYRQAVDHLAKEIIRRAGEADAKPVQIGIPPKDGGGDGSGTPPSGGAAAEPGDGEPVATSPYEAPAGIFDTLAAGEEATGRIATTLGQITPVLEGMDADATKVNQQMERANAQGKGFAARLTAFRSFAKDLSKRADDLEPLVLAYTSDVLLVDQTTRLIFRIAKDTGSEEEYRPFVDSIKGFAETSVQSLGALEELAQILENNSNWSKDLRAPSARLQTLLRQLADSQRLFEDWQRLADDLLPTAE